MILWVQTLHEKGDEITETINEHNHRTDSAKIVTGKAITENEAPSREYVRGGEYNLSAVN